MKTAAALLCLSAVAFAGDDDFLFSRHAKNVATTRDTKVFEKSLRYLLESGEKGHLAILEGFTERKEDVASGFGERVVFGLIEWTVPKEKETLPKTTALVLDFMKRKNPRFEVHRSHLDRCMRFLGGYGAPYAADAIPVLRTLEDAEDVGLALTAKRTREAIEKATKK